MTSVIRTNIGSALLSLRKSKTLSMREAAEELKISERTLYRKIKEYNLE